MLQLTIFVFGGQSEMGLQATLNLVVAAAYIAFGVGLLQRTKWGYDWALGSGVLNLFWMGAQILNGAWLLIPSAIVAVTVAGLLYPVRDQFTSS